MYCNLCRRINVESFKAYKRISFVFSLLFSSLKDKYRKLINRKNNYRVFIYSLPISQSYCMPDGKRERE